MSEDKDLIWVPKKIADEYKAAESDETKEKIIKRILDKQKIDIESEFDRLNEVELQFKAICITHKNTLEKVYKEQYDMLYKLWEETGDVYSEVSNKNKELKQSAEKTNDVVKSIKDNIDNINKVLNFDVYAIERFVALIDKLNMADAKTKEMLQFLMTSFAKTNQ